MTSEAELYAALNRLGIGHRTVDHAATHTVAEGEAVKAGLPGGHSKSLLVEDKRHLFLLVALGSVRVDLKGTANALGSGRLRFASPETLEGTLGLRPGSVTPFGLLAPGAPALSAVVLDEALLAQDPLWCHPLRNTASTALAPTGLVRFCEAHAARVVRMNLADPVMDLGTPTWDESGSS